MSDAKDPVSQSSTMRVLVTAQPKFHFKLTLEQVDVIGKCSREHYDFACQLFAGGSTMKSWKNMATHGFECVGNKHDVQTAITCLEVTQQLSREESQVAVSLRPKLRRILAECNRITDRWTEEFEV